MFEMDDEYSESDIPTVLIRSVADCPIQEVSRRSFPIMLYSAPFHLI